MFPSPLGFNWGTWRTRLFADLTQFRGWFVLANVAVGRVFLQVVLFPPVSIFLPGRLTFEAWET